MKETPILFSAPMVRAILEGRKTQTRRIVKPPPHPDFGIHDIKCHWYEPTMIDRRTGEAYPGPAVFGFAGEDNGWVCKFGPPGSRLWVKETWRTRKEWDYYKPTSLPISAEEIRDPEWCAGQYITYATADEGGVKLHGRLRPSIFMPRWASRITLEIVAVRVERLQDISEEDALAEGVTNADSFRGIGANDRMANRYAYRELWQSINGESSWDANPWVWVVEFKRI